MQDAGIIGAIIILFGGEPNNGGRAQGNRNRPPPRPEHPQTLRAMKQHPDHPLRMKVLWEELHWAKKIKAAIEANPAVDNLSDYMYAQMALKYSADNSDGLDYNREEDPDDAAEDPDAAAAAIEDNALAVVVSKAEALQEYRREYGIVESYEDGCRALRRLAQLYPGLILGFEFDPDGGTYMWAVDMGQFDLSVRTTDGLNAFFGGFYYFLLCFCPDLQSIHNGFIALVECKGMGWDKKKELKMFLKLANELILCYPNSGLVRHYNTGAIMNGMWHTVKKVLPKKLADQFEFGLEFEDGLDSIYLVPDVETATQRLLTRMEAALRIRFDNEHRFSLDNDEDIVPQTDDDIEILCGARGM